MNGYIQRLVNCGLSIGVAVSTYIDYINNFTIPELEVYVRSMEINQHVGKV